MFDSRRMASAGRQESILATNLPMEGGGKKPKGPKRKKKHADKTAMNETQLLTKIAEQTAEMLTHTAPTDTKLDTTYAVQVKHTEVTVEKSTSATSSTVKLTAETCLKRTGGAPAKSRRLESVSEDADSTLRSEGEPVTVKKKKKTSSDLSRMPNPLASSSIMLNKPAVGKTPKTSAQLYAAVSESGKVKKMIEEVEARIKATPGTAATRTGLGAATVSAAAKKLQYSASSSSASTRVLNNQKLRSSIDKRKQRVSGTKVESKRASLRKVNALLKGITEKGVDQTDEARKPPTVAHEPKVAPFDDSVLSNASSTISLKAKQRELLGSSHLIQQNYKLNQKLAPPSAGLSTASLTSSARKISGFNKFLERNTPCKLTHTVS